MAPSGKESEKAETQSGVFATTHWSVVLEAGNSESPPAAAALEKLCRTYWYPLYAYVRRRGYGHEDAQDLTQGFLLQLLERKSFGRVDRSKGRFRSFLLAGLNNFLADQRDRANAQKPGGGHTILSLDSRAAEQRYRLEPVDDRSPDKLFERAWAMALLDSVLGRLEEEYREVGKAELFERLREFLVTGMEPATYAEAGAETGMTGEAVRKAVYRLRHRYYALFREEIARTVADASEVEEEMRYLCDVIAR
jgi:RNA polymerase sigma-70 factor (ECF subfamily)